MSDEGKQLDPTALDEALVETIASKENRDPVLVRLEMAAREAHAAGYDFEFQDGVIIPPRENIEHASIDFGDKHFSIGVVSDTHCGSRFEQRSALHRFYEYAEPSVDCFLHAGDLLQGPDNMHPGMSLEVHAHGADAQVNYVVEDYPYSPKGTYVLGGNHDASFLKNGQTNVIRRVSERRDDIHRLGQDAAYVNLGGLKAFGIHPAGGGSYAKSYKGQKISETIEDEIGLILIGHYHHSDAHWRKRTKVRMLPCFQGKYAWLAAKSLDPEVGGIIMDIWLDSHGRIARYREEEVRFDEISHDWNHDASDRAADTWQLERENEVTLPE